MFSDMGWPVVTPPTPPGDLPGTVTGFTCTADSNDFACAWDAVLAVSGQADSVAATDYAFKARLALGGSVVFNQVTSNTSFASPPAVPSGVTAVFSVAGRNAQGQEGPEPRTQPLTFPAGGSPPPGPSCTAAPDTPTDVTYTVAINRVTAKWTPATTGCPATTYILRGFTGGTQLTELDAGNVTTFDFPAVVPTGQYTVQLVARNVNGDSAPAVDSVNVP